VVLLIAGVIFSLSNKKILAADIQTNQAVIPKKFTN